jgi:hypothetical protein
VTKRPRLKKRFTCAAAPCRHPRRTRSALPSVCEHVLNEASQLGQRQTCTRNPSMRRPALVRPLSGFAVPTQARDHVAEEPRPGAGILPRSGQGQGQGCLKRLFSSLVEAALLSKEKHPSALVCGLPRIHPGPGPPACPGLPRTHCIHPRQARGSSAPDHVAERKGLDRVTDEKNAAPRGWPKQAREDSDKRRACLDCLGAHGRSGKPACRSLVASPHLLPSP